MRALLDRYEKENPGVKVVMDTVAYADLDKTLQPQAEAGTPPDLARVTSLALYTKYLLDMTPYLKDAAAWEKNWSPQFLQALRPSGETKGLFGFPTQFTVSGPYINRTLFAQRRLKPEDVLPEWQKTLAVLGGEADVERFLRRASVQLGAPLEATTGAHAGHWKLHATSLPGALK